MNAYRSLVVWSKHISWQANSYCFQCQSEYYCGWQLAQFYWYKRPIILPIRRSNQLWRLFYILAQLLVAFPDFLDCSNLSSFDHIHCQFLGEFVRYRLAKTMNCFQHFFSLQSFCPWPWRIFDRTLPEITPAI